MGSILIPTQVFAMRGYVRSRQVCPACGLHKWQGQQVDILCDRGGARLTTLAQAEQVLAMVQAEVEAGTFLPKVWGGPGRGELVWENYLEAYLLRERAGPIRRNKGEVKCQ
jgi:hypothetical protein